MAQQPISPSAKPTRRLRAWPAVVWPLGATLLFLGGAILFINKVGSDQQKADAAALRLESYARLEAGDLATRARSLGHLFVESRLQRRAEQEKNSHLLVRGVMDGVQRVLGAGLEKSRSASTLRDVGEFPTGFEGLRVYLELSGAGDRGNNAALTALRACAPELAELLPPGCSLTVVENNFEELLSLGGGTVPDNPRVTSVAREFIWGDGEESRHWTLQVSLAEKDEYPYPDAAELGAHLAEQLGNVRLADAVWRGWLVDRSGKAVGSFPSSLSGNVAVDANLPPFVDAWDEWVEVDRSRLVWMNRAESLSQIGIAPAVAVSIAMPPPPLVPADVFAKDLRWSTFLTAFLLLSLGLWAWFIRAMMTGRGAGMSSRRTVAAPASAPAPTAPVVPQPRKRGAAVPIPPLPRGRLVRAASAERPIGADAANLIVADIDDETGEVHVETIVQPPRGPAIVIPSGSLLRLQERHRGGTGRKGSRVLDHAKSKLLRELAGRVRPVVEGRESSAPKSGKGWDKVG
ncbi:MAG: hypothetical protein LUC93_11940 [Planctomycetaceae bacterium]|nr:hypothetical protein [Planctomycetaceae bacterium]